MLQPRPVTIHHLEFLGFKRCGWGSPLPSGRGLGEGAHRIVSYVPLAKQEQAIDRAQAVARHEATEAEKSLWGVLRGRRFEGLKFRRQHSFGHYIADFICLEQKLVIEIDGGLHASAEHYDAKRTAYFESQGFRVLRFWNNEILGNLEGVVLAIRSQIEGTLTQPSPPRGEGFTAHFRATVSEGTYIRSLGRDIAQALGSEGVFRGLHRAAVGPFTDSAAISLDFLEKSVHNAAPPGVRPHG